MAVASITSTHCAVLKYLDLLTAIIICQLRHKFGDIIICSINKKCSWFLVFGL